jgi:hypothetical protein
MRRTRENGGDGLTPIRIARFWSYVDRSGECWIWTSSRDKDGYGVYRVGKHKRRAHRVSLELVGRPVPDGMVTDHLCRNPSCVRPDHLDIVTGAENNRRGASPAAFNAAKERCDCGAEFVREGYKSRPNKRVCRACRALHARLKRAELRMNGLCEACGKRPLACAHRCQECRDRRNRVARERRAGVAA